MWISGEGRGFGKSTVIKESAGTFKYKGETLMQISSAKYGMEKRVMVYDSKIKRYN